MPARRILIVDYEKVIADTLAQIFSLAGYEVRAEYAGDLALKAATEWPPDLVILDFILDGINGLDCAKQLREQCPGCRVILLHAQVADRLLQDALAHGYEVYGKPIDPRTLLARAEALLIAPTRP